MFPTLLIIIATTLVTLSAFNNRELFYKLQFNPYQVYHRKQWYRLITHGFIHADWNHVIFNMLSLFFFGPYVANAFDNVFLYFLLYFGGMVIATITTLRKHKDNHWYNSVGASGGVSSIIFASIIISPWSSIYFIFIPIPIPAIVFGILFLIYSNYMSRKNTDNINHDAHFLGAIFGLTFPILVNKEYFYHFIEQLIGRFL